MSNQLGKLTSVPFPKPSVQMKLRAVIFLCEVTTANLYWRLWPFHKLFATTDKSPSSPQSGPACLVS